MSKKYFLGALLLLVSAQAAHAMRAQAFERVFREHSDDLCVDHVCAMNSLWQPTPSQPSGPFYPRPLPSEKDNDLSMREGKHAEGSIIQIQGQVFDPQGHALKDAHVEIWQACMTGSYEHADDTNPAPRDPNFQYYGSDLSNADGFYSFKTIVPGPYPASDTWIRPPHIHMKVSALNFKTLVTQLYFDGSSFPTPVALLGEQEISGADIDYYNSADELLLRLTPAQRSRLIVNFQDINQIKLGVFNIYLQR